MDLILGISIGCVVGLSLALMPWALQWQRQRSDPSWLYSPVWQAWYRYDVLTDATLSAKREGSGWKWQCTSQGSSRSGTAKTRDQAILASEAARSLALRELTSRLPTRDQVGRDSDS